MLAFLPNIGAPISGALMIMVGFSGGTTMGLYCIGIYVVVQTIDGNVIVPMVAKRAADLAPALVLSMQLIMGAMFGILGLALADPRTPHTDERDPGLRAPARTAGRRGPGQVVRDGRMSAWRAGFFMWSLPGSCW